MTSTRIRALEAALDLLGTGGLRALTHARVDDRAGLPKGSTSNHFRTRAALLAGVADWLGERGMSEVSAPPVPRTAEELVTMLCDLIGYQTGPDRVITTARLVLFMEASHNPDVQAALTRGHQGLRTWTVSVLAGLGAPDPQAAADALMTCCDGLIMHNIAWRDDTDPRPAVELVVRAALAGPRVASGATGPAPRSRR
ncbi:TetR family transcriptional regulator C-terminal domain-containing protein [Longispora sp. K20-0274]|uniref:TetR/AcrR family transcriptional regulator n=1 Tax=Longispora sp. K20-0274 TaxID=3088255 RepID=UPI00399A74BE